MMEFFSESFAEATDKFINNSKKFGELKIYSNPKTTYDVPVLTIGNGANKIVINTGIHGLEGFSGSSALNMFLSLNSGFLKENKNFQIVLIHCINGFGMDHRTRENANNVDLNRNFRNWDIPPKQNELYKIAHKLLISKPGKEKYHAIVKFRHDHKSDGVWSAISRGQYEFPDGIFYGGAGPEPEYFIVQNIYDDLMRDAKSLLSIGLHTGLGDYKLPTLLVSHPTGHTNTVFFQKTFEPALIIEPDEKNTVNSANLSGDLVDWLEVKYQDKKIPIMTADIEIGTGTNRGLSPILKRMDQGDARYEIKHFGCISDKTKNNLSEDWYPRDSKWRRYALSVYDVLAMKLERFINEYK